MNLEMLYIYEIVCAWDLLSVSHMQGLKLEAMGSDDRYD